MNDTRKKIFVVDDDQRIVLLIESVLKNNGYVVKTERNALNACRSAIDFKPDLIFLDVAMPDKDGGDVLREMRNSPVLANTPITFMTGIVSANEVGGTSGSLGNQEYLPKPVAPDVLIQYVQNKLSAG